MLKPEDYFDLSHTQYAEIFSGVEYVWDALKRLGDFVQSHLLQPGIYGEVNPLASIEGDVYIGPGTTVDAGAVIKGPVIIGEDCQIRTGAFIRNNVLIGNRVTIGHTTEVKYSILFDEAKAPHFSYIGDSILGYQILFGAGVKTSNVKINHTPVSVKYQGRRYDTGLEKFGAIVGDRAKIGCNTVLNPGTLVGPGTLAYANLSLHGIYPANSIVKLRQEQEVVSRK